MQRMRKNENLGKPNKNAAMMSAKLQKLTLNAKIEVRANMLKLSCLILIFAQYIFSSMGATISPIGDPRA